MNILMLSKNGDGLGIAQKLVEEGHEVNVWIKEPGFKFAGMGIVNRVTGWRPHLPSADFVIADMVGFGNIAKTLDKFEVMHFGFNEIADTVELDRSKQMELFRKVGISIPETHEFSTPNEALDLLDEWGGAKGWVVKPSGNLDTGRTYHAHDKDTYKWVLEQYSGSQSLVVQRFMDGVEISTEGWFNGSKWLEPFNHTFEEKRLFPNNLGPNTGCMGNVVVQAGNDKLVKELKKLTTFLSLANYRGPVDLNCIVNEQGIFALELTPRLGYDAIEALHEIMNEPMTDLLMGVASGSKENIRLKDGFVSMAVRLAIPPYPFKKADPNERGLPIKGLPSTKTLAHYYLTDVHKERDKYKWAASDGALMKITGSAKSVKSARQLTMQRVKKVDVMGAFWRDDIGSRVDSDVKQLQEWKVL